MKQSSHQAEESLHQSEYHIHEALLHRHYSTADLNDPLSTYFEDPIHSPQDLESHLESLIQYNDSSSNHRYVSANERDQSHMPNSGVDAQNASHDPLHSEVSLSFVARNDNDLRRGAETYAELSSSGNRSHEVGRGETYLPQEGPPHPYNMHRKSVSLASPATAPMQLLPYPSSRHSSAPPQAAGQSNFAAFGRLFNNSADAKRHRHIKMRFDRHAYDENDSSIALVEAHRQRHVERIYNAMTRGDLARDNAGSTAMKRWTREPHYPSDLVEAYAHKVFDCLLEQAKEGFRGWHHNDYVADDRKGEDEDRDVNCAGRLENVINALELEKTICEDVMNSACQIRMFVNAPKAYSNRKHQNRVGNSKRPGAKASTLDPTTRSSKVRKTSDRRSRARSSTTSSMITSSNVTVQPPREMSIMPPFTNPALQRVSSSAPSGGFHAPQAPAMHQPIVRSQRSSFGQHQATPISPSATSPRATSYTISLPHIPRITSMPPAQQSPFLSPPLLSQGHFSAPATPDDMNSSNVDAPLNSWPQTSMCSDSFSAAFQGSHTSGDTCFPQVADWSQNVSTFAPFTPCELAGTANYFEHHPEIGVTMADVEQQPPTQVGDISHNVDLSSVWQQQQSVQPFTYNGLPSEYPNQL